VSSIQSRQVEPAAITVQQAAAVLHRRAQIIEATRTSIAVVLAALGLVGTAIQAADSTAAILGFIWTPILAGFATPLLRRQLRRAVELQEIFDTQVFGLSWNKGIAGDQPSNAEIHHLGQKLKPSSKRMRHILEGWYDNMAGIPYPLDVLACQEQNLSWDLQLRARYRNLITLALTIWFILGIIIGFAQHASLDQVLLGWYAPSLPAFTVGVEIFANQDELISEKRRLLRWISKIAVEVRSEADIATQTELLQVARNLQDGIFASRMITPRVPYLVYRLFRSHDERRFEKRVATWQAKPR
jgi:predicted pore-forming effector associated with SMODS systems